MHGFERRLLLSFQLLDLLVLYFKDPTVFAPHLCHPLPLLTSTLTEPGLNYKSILTKQRLDYIADKWTDITACIISVIALIVSIHTALSS